jgi:hypothetical protein
LERPPQRRFFKLKGDTMKITHKAEALNLGCCDVAGGDVLQELISQRAEKCLGQRAVIGTLDHGIPQGEIQAKVDAGEITVVAWGIIEHQ